MTNARKTAQGKGRRNGLKKPQAPKPISRIQKHLSIDLAKHPRSGPPLHRTRPPLFVLDTNVLMHDPTSLFRFEEHDIYIASTVLHELDRNKSGHEEPKRNARQASRYLDEIQLVPDGTMSKGFPLNRVAKGRGTSTGRLFFQVESFADVMQADPLEEKGDAQIRAVVAGLKKKYPNRPIVLVSKDIIMRIIARMQGLLVEDYFNDKVMEDTELLPVGYRELPSDFWEKHSKGIESGGKGAVKHYRVRGPFVSRFSINEFVYLEDNDATPFYAVVKAKDEEGAVLHTLTNYTSLKNAVWGIAAKNREQNFALNLLMDPEIDFVTLMGQAGTGKTLLTLAAALQQTLELKLYTEIIMTRVTVPIGEDIGFLPGTEEDKMNPWMGALDDNLDVLNKTDDEAGDWGRAATRDLVRSRVKVKSLNFMRGRTFLNKFLIIDEAQNLTSKQIKTLITRAGPGTKVVCLGNIAQIDTPYLTEGSSGITYVVDRFKGWRHGGHVTLARGERSRLADHAAEVL